MLLPQVPSRRRPGSVHARGGPNGPPQPIPRHRPSALPREMLAGATPVADADVAATWVTLANRPAGPGVPVDREDRSTG